MIKNLRLAEGADDEKNQFNLKNQTGKDSPLEVYDYSQIQLKDNKIQILFDSLSEKEEMKYDDNQSESESQFSKSIAARTSNMRNSNKQYQQVNATNQSQYMRVINYEEEKEEVESKAI